MEKATFIMLDIKTHTLMFFLHHIQTSFTPVLSHFMTPQLADKSFSSQTCLVVGSCSVNDTLTNRFICKIFKH